MESVDNPCLEINLSIPIYLDEQESGQFKATMPYLFSGGKTDKVFGLGPTLEEAIESFEESYRQYSAVQMHIFQEEHGGNPNISQKEIPINTHYEVHVSPATYKRIHESEDLKNYFLQFENSNIGTKFYCHAEKKQ